MNKTQIPSEEAILAALFGIKENAGTAEGENQPAAKAEEQAEPVKTDAEDSCMKGKTLENDAEPAESAPTQDSTLKGENEQLKRQVEALLNMEEKRINELMLDEMKRKYADFEPETVYRQMRAMAEKLSERYNEQGFEPEKAHGMAKRQVRFLWENPKGIEDLYLLHKARSTPGFGLETKQIQPDMHISGTSSAIPPRNWKDKIKSNVQAERDSVFNELL